MSKKASSIAKGIAILMMLFHHLFYSEANIQRNSGGLELSFWPFSVDEAVLFAKAMRICVAVFVFITAYGTFVQLAKKTEGHNTDLPRIYAAYSTSHWVKLIFNFWAVALPFIALGFAMPVHNPIDVYGNHGLASGLFYVTADIFGLANLFGTPTMNDTWWYMSLAYCLIFLMPLLHAASRRVGSINVFALSIMVPLLSGLDMDASLLQYFPTAALGTVFAEYRLFEKWNRRITDRASAALDMIATIAILALCLAARTVNYPWIFDPVGVLMICHFAQRIEKVSIVLNFLDKHSMNMFMLHTFIYCYYFGWVVYSAYWFGAVLIALTVVSLAASCVIELAKRITRCNDARDSVANRIGELFGS